MIVCMFAGCSKGHRVDEQGSCLNLHYIFGEEFIYVSQTNIHILLEASQLHEVLLQKDNDLHELRDANATLEKKVSWIYFSANARFYIGSIPFDQQLRSGR